MKKRIVYGKKIKYFLDDKEVSKAEFDSSIRIEPLDVGRTKVEHHTAGYQGYPILSDALAVHPDQRQEAYDHSVKSGVPTEFARDGRAIIRDAAHRRQYLKRYGFHDRNSFYGT